MDHPTKPLHDSNIVQATENDLEAIYQNEIACYQSPWSKNMIKQSLSKQILLEQVMLEPVMLDSQLNSGNINITLMMMNGSKNIGHMIIQWIVDEIHLHNLCILPEYQNMQYGQKWIDCLMAIYKYLTASQILLEVRESNVKAINLYKKNGFKSLAMRKNYYSCKESKRKENALIYSFS